MSETFTVRKVSYGVGVERTLPLHSPGVTKVEIKSRGFVRRSRLYYLRDLRDGRKPGAEHGRPLRPLGGQCWALDRDYPRFDETAESDDATTGR